MTQVFCPMPWITQSTRNNGDLRICCQANVGYDQGLARKHSSVQDIYYLVEWSRTYIPDPEIFINASLQKNNRFIHDYYKGIDIDIANIFPYFKGHSALLKNLSVNKTILMRAVFKKNDSIVTGMLFKNKSDATQYIKDSNLNEISELLSKQNFDVDIDIIQLTTEDAEDWVKNKQIRHTQDIDIVQENKINLDYIDFWQLRDTGEVYNAKDANLNEARNCSMLKQARLDMLEGIWPQACKRCEDEEAAGIRSRMQYERERWDKLFDVEQAHKNTKADGSINTDKLPVVFYDLRFGNLCNLKCRMCGPTDSSQWYDEQVKMFGNTYQDTQGIVELVQDEKGRYKPKIDLYNWYENSAFWEQLEANITDIRHLYLVGGEPLMIDQHYEFLQKCIDRNESHHITLEYNTNITNIPERAWNIWKYFEKIEIGASVDGVGKIVEYIRHPAKWRILERNMRRLDDAEGNFKMWLAPTIGILNSRHLPDMIIWVLEQNFKLINAQSWKPPVTPHPLHHPKWLNIKILPPEAKKEITEYYEICKPRIRELIFSQTDKGPEKKEELYSKTIALLDNYAIFMNNDDWSELLPKFWELNTKLDNIRGESLENAVPELYNLIKYSKPEK